MDYEIFRLSKELVFIRWQRTPTPNAGTEDQFLKDLQALLDQSPNPVYFISDLRRGRITSMRVLQRLAQLTGHKHWAGSTAFSKDPLTAIFVRSFKAFRKEVNSRDAMHSTPEEALSFLETLKPSITWGIDWRAALGEAGASV